MNDTTKSATFAAVKAHDWWSFPGPDNTPLAAVPGLVDPLRRHENQIDKILFL
jgi:hypothetical protein